jgi:hypothetical protein
MPPLFRSRRRKWIFFALAVSTHAGCIRFRSDAPAGVDASTSEDAGADVEHPVEGGDALPPPICEQFGPNIAERIAVDLLAKVRSDCVLRRHFANVPPIAATHLQECLTAQIGQIMGCKHADGTPFKYPTLDSNQRFCRDMKSSHASFNLSDGDFDAFIAATDTVLDANGLDTADKMRVLSVLGATRNDIVRLKDAGPTAPCDAPDANE